MKSRTTIVLAAFSTLAPLLVVAQPRTPAPTALAEPAAAPEVMAFGGDNQADPGYAAYKEGYSLVLEEKWKDARKKFAEMLAKYPKSEYVDDARYWAAYSMKHIDRKAAIQEYERFIEAHGNSRYYDDAVADLSDLRPQAVTVTPHPSRAGVTVSALPAIAPPASMPHRSMERAMRLEMRQLGRLRRGSLIPFVPRAMGTDETLDAAAQLKMEALYALGETTEDDKSYSTLRDVALDTKQPRPLREAAMDALTNFTKHDVLQVFVEIASRDTSADIQGYAIDFIGEHGSDKNQNVTILSDLFRTLPRSRSEQRASIVYAVADVGNDRAVDFLKTVAMGDEDIDLRRDAVYYLGNIGGDRARAALYEILKGK